MLRAAAPCLLFLGSAFAKSGSPFVPPVLEKPPMAENMPPMDPPPMDPPPVEDPVPPGGGDQMPEIPPPPMNLPENPPMMLNPPMMEDPMDNPAEGGLDDARDLDSKAWYNYVGKFRIQVQNIAFQQPMSRFFVSVHDASSLPLYQLGQPATEALALLAEDGNPQPLVDLYTDEDNQAGVLSAAIATDGALVVGQPLTFDVETSFSYPYVSFASMAINTNDCFVGVAGIMLTDGMVLDLPGLDAGSEENNELCSSIPGPACADIDTGNVRSGNGEGVVHVHRGFFGIGPDLGQSGYDWRNPMLRVTVQRI